MKFSSGNWHSSLQVKPTLWVALLAAGMLGVGCGKAKNSGTESTTPSAESVKQAEKDHMPVYSPASPTAPAVIATADGGPDMGELNRSLLRWVLRNRRRPNNFEDFAATAGVTIPPPPDGKKYLLGGDMKIQLVNR